MQIKNCMDDSIFFFFFLQIKNCLDDSIYFFKVLKRVVYHIVNTCYFNTKYHPGSLKVGYLFGALIHILTYTNRF